MQIFQRDEDGWVDQTDLSHLGASVGVDYESLTKGFVHRMDPGTKKSSGEETVQYMGLDRRLHPHKQRDEGERRIGCPRNMTPVIRRLIGTIVRAS